MIKLLSKDLRNYPFSMTDSIPALKLNANVNFGLRGEAKLKRLHTYSEFLQDAEQFGSNPVKYSSTCFILNAWAFKDGWKYSYVPNVKYVIKCFTGLRPESSVPYRNEFRVHHAAMA